MWFYNRFLQEILLYYSHIFSTFLLKFLYDFIKQFISGSCRYLTHDLSWDFIKDSTRDSFQMLPLTPGIFFMLFSTILSKFLPGLFPGYLKNIFVGNLQYSFQRFFQNYLHGYVLRFLRRFCWETIRNVFEHPPRITFVRWRFFSPRDLFQIPQIFFQEFTQFIPNILRKFFSGFLLIIPVIPSGIFLDFYRRLFQNPSGISSGVLA